MTRAVVSVATGLRFCGGLRRLVQRLDELEEPKIFWYDCLPPGSPTHEETPYGFKINALEQAAERADVLLWMDSSVIVMHPLEPLWKLIEEQGYWFSDNHGYITAEFCSDAALVIMGLTREQAYEIPQVVATTFGLNMRTPIAREFLSKWKELRDRGAFKGPWMNTFGEASEDPRVRGHRHDQTAASVVAWQLGIKLTYPPAWFADEGFEGSDETLLTTKRNG